MLQAAGRQTLSTIQVMDLYGNSDPDLQVGSYLPSMPRLTALSVAACQCTTISSLLHLVANMPPSLTHLNASDNNFGPSLVEITKKKEQLKELNRLNIGYGEYNMRSRRVEFKQEEELEAIRQEMLDVNPDLRVYYKGEEDLWDMYKEKFTK